MNLTAHPSTRNLLRCIKGTAIQSQSSFQRNSSILMQYPKNPKKKQKKNTKKPLLTQDEK